MKLIFTSDNGDISQVTPFNEGDDYTAVYAEFYRQLQVKLLNGPLGKAPSLVIGKTNDDFLNYFDKLPYVTQMEKVFSAHGIDDIEAHVLPFPDGKDWVVEMEFAKNSIDLPLHTHPGLRILTCRPGTKGIFVYAIEVTPEGRINPAKLQTVEMTPGVTVAYPANTPHTFYTKRLPFRTATYHGSPTIVPFDHPDQFAFTYAMNGKEVYPGLFL